MVPIKKTADEVIRHLRTFTNPERQAFTVNYFPSAMENLGVAVGDIRKVVAKVKKLVKSESPDTVLDLAHAILARNTLEGRQAAYEIVANHPDTLTGLGVRDLEALGKGMDNWTSVDVFSTSLAGQCWREGQIKDSSVRRWARSKDRWWRRAALVSTIPLNMKSRGGSGDIDRTLAQCELLVEDEDEMVQKGLSWALRALIPVNAEAVAEFLREHVDGIGKRVRREVENKLKTGKKSGKG